MSDLPSGVVTIKNVKHNEVLYCSDARKDAKRRHVLTYIGGNSPPCPEKAAQWKFIPRSGGLYQICNAQTNELLYAGGSLYNEERRHVFTWISHKELDKSYWLVEKHGMGYKIKSYLQEVLYLNEPGLNEANRQALTWIPCKSPAPHTSQVSLWYIEAVPEASMFEHISVMADSLRSLQERIDQGLSQLTKRIDQQQRQFSYKLQRQKKAEIMRSRELEHLNEKQQQIIEQQITSMKVKYESECEWQRQLIAKLEQEKLSLRGELSDISNQFISSIVSKKPIQQNPDLPCREAGIESPSIFSGSEWNIVSEENAMSVQTDPLPADQSECLLPGSILRTPTGSGVRVECLRPGMELVSLEGTPVKVSKKVDLPQRERDLIQVLTSAGTFKITSDHFVLAQRPGQKFTPTQAKDICADMKVYASQGPLTIHEIQKLPSVATKVVQFFLEDPNAVVLMDVGFDAVCIFGSKQIMFECKVDFLKGMCDVVEVKSDVSRKAASEPPLPTAVGALSSHGHFPLSIGSNGHPMCSGICNLYKKGHCKFAARCMACHVITCMKNKSSKGKQQRLRAKKRGLQQ